MMRAARLTGLPKRSSSRRSTIPRCSPARTRSGIWLFAAKPASDCCNVAVALSASSESPNAAYIPSPVIFTITPRFASTAFRDNASCSAKARAIRAPSCSHRRVLPSISVNKRVVTPDDACTPNSWPAVYSTRTLQLRTGAANRGKSASESRIIALVSRVTAHFRWDCGSETSTGTRGCRYLAG